MNNKIYTREEIKKKSNDIFAKKSFIDKVYLFGSYAKNADILTEKEINEIMPRTFEKKKILIYEQ